MESTFDPDAFIQGVGRRLVEEFEIARTATSPSTVGAAMEQPVRKQLEQILPRGIGVGTGFVIDTYGETSRQIQSPGHTPIIIATLLPLVWPPAPA